MKNINQIFLKNPELMEEKAVQELIEYCQELEEDVIFSHQKKVFEKEDHLANLVREIYSSVVVTLKEDEDSIRFKETPRVNFEESVKNLKKYLEKFSENFNFGL